MCVSMFRMRGMATCQVCCSTALLSLFLVMAANTRNLSSTRGGGRADMPAVSVQNRRILRRHAQRGGLHNNGSPSSCKVVPLRLPLLMQAVGLLHLSAICARAVAVAGAVLSPHIAAAATAGKAMNGHGGATPSAGATAAGGSAASTAVSSGAASAAAAVGRTKALSQQAPSAFVSSSTKGGVRGLRPAGRPVSVGSRRVRTKVCEARGAPRAAIAASAAFVQPVGPAYGRSCYDSQRRRYNNNGSLHHGVGGNGLRRSRPLPRIVSPSEQHSMVSSSSSSSVGSIGSVGSVGSVASTADAGGFGMPGRGATSGVGTAAAVAAVVAAEAMASAADRVSRLSRPGKYGGGGDKMLSRSRSSLNGFRALAAASAPGSNEPDRSVDSDGGVSGDSGSSSSGNGGVVSGIFGQMGVLQMLMALVRWLLPGGRTSGNRQERARMAVTAADMQPREGSSFFYQLFQWIARPFASLESFVVNRSGRRGSGGRLWRQRRSKTITPGGREQRAVLQPVQSQGRTIYPRPQSTAYPRPQSTAYPRPKVSTPTLLGLEVEKPEVLRPRAERLALAAAGQEHDSWSPAVSKDPLWSKFLVWFFERVITSRANLVEGLQVNVDARSNREAMSGLLQSVGITFNHLELENLQISGGARMNIIGLDLKVMTLLWKRFASFKKPFEVEGSYVLTSSDLASSPLVRRLVTNMMNSTLRKLEALATEPLRNSSIDIKQVSAKRSRLVIEGEMTYGLAKVPFTYRTSIGVRGKGHVVFLKDAEVFWENVGGSLSLPLLPLETFDVDMGEGARIESIRIVNGQVALKARVVISPFPPLLVASLRKRAAFSFDVAERLSVAFGNLVQNMKILRFQIRPNQA